MTSRISSFASEAGAEILKAMRAPEFVIPTLLLPVAFYVFFAIAMPGGGQKPLYMLATFGVFAVMGPAIFGFGAGVAHERDRGWLQLKRAAPAPAASYVGAKLLTTVLFAALAIALIYAMAGFVAGVALPRSTWLLLFAVHLIAAVPFALIGLTLGFSFGSNAAVAVANILFLALAALGGLWLPVFLLPDALQTVANFLPSYHLSEIALWVVRAPGERDPFTHLAVVCVMTVLFGGLTLIAWLRQRT